MEKMGWKSGQGLGLNNDGTTSHIKISAKDDNLGIGASQKDAETGWLNNSKSYQDVLDRLAKSVEKDEIKEKEEEKKKSKKDRKEAKKDRKKSEKKEDKKSKKDRKKAEKKSQEKVQKAPTILKSAHRAKFIRNKAVSSYSEANLKEILGGFNIWK